MGNNKNQLTYKDMNFFRIGGPIFVLVSPVFFSLDKKLPMFVLAGWGFLIFGVLATLFSSTLTVTADKSTRILQLRYSYLLFRQTKEIPFDDIVDIQSQVSRGESGTGHSTNVYRIVVVLYDGRIMPFRSYFTQDDSKKKIAAKFRLFIIGKQRSDVERVESPSATLSM